MVTGALMAPFNLRASDDKINIAILGTGCWGRDLLMKCALSSKKFNIIGLCDVNSVALQKASEIVTNAGNPKPKLFTSYQEMYEMPGLQAVAIATPTHWHAL